MIAIDDDGRIQAWCSSKAPCRARLQLAQALGLQDEHCTRAEKIWKAQHIVQRSQGQRRHRDQGRPNHVPATCRAAGRA